MEKEIKLPVITEEEAQSILKGVRPEGMDFAVFKHYKRLMNKHIKKHLQGTYFWKSIGYKDGQRVTATYVKPETEK